MRVEFRLSGSGGQGLLLAGIVLAEAVIQEGKNAIQTQSYGPEARGGSSKAEVVVSDTDIDYPKATDPDYLLALTTDAYRSYGLSMKKGLILVDTSVQVEPEAPVPVVKLPILETASKKLGRGVVANMVALGVLGGISGIASPAALREAVRNRVPKGTEDLNLAAVDAGLALAEEGKKQIEGGK
ncbi:MAG: 2-oxoacid:acceptor oxidoreductase family protein [Spirochaetales bacterium]|nr:2-oxoacid:acceptor oxidoreductase family protein [Spirochaetales bacterium]